MGDFVIVDFERKAIICIEAKATLTGSAGHKAVEQTLELKSLLEKYFASELTVGEWLFVGMIYTNNINTKMQQSLCPPCSSFVIEGPSELHTKLLTIQNDLEQVRVICSPNHAQFVSLLQILVFVVLQQRISTHCTIAGDVHEKVVGKNKDKPTGQGDFRSIIFWTNEQANIMLTVLQFVFFISPWSTGKTICMREKAVMWATQNPTAKLFFVVLRDELTNLTSLLEMELKDFFHQQHNLKNVEVLGLPTKPKDTLSSLLKEVTTRPSGCSFMVDELVLPKEKEQKQVTKELEQLQNHFEAQPAKPPLWIACAGIHAGEAEHFERSYMTSILPPAFHLPEMDVPLRNTKQTLALAGLEMNKGVKGLNFIDGTGTQTNPVYKVPDNLMEGVAGKEFLVNNRDVARVVEEATEELLRRTGGVG